MMGVLPQSSRQSGFSLVEVAMALLVVSVGILGAFGLFPGGLEAGKASLDETRAIFFAEETFNGFRALATEVSWAGLDTSIPATLGDRLWDEADDLAPRVTSTVRLNKYVSYGDKSPPPTGHFVVNPDFDDGITEYAVRYVLEAEDLTGKRLALRLWVWPGEFGNPEEGNTPNPTQKDNAFFFYTEIYDFRGPDDDPNAGPMTFTP